MGVSKRGGSRKHPADCKCGNCPAIGRPKVKTEQPADAPTKDLATRILNSLAIPDVEWKKEHPDISKDPAIEHQCEMCLWRAHARRDRGALEYLWNRRDGRPVQTINHQHDKPLKMNVTVSMAEVVRKVRQRKAEYERNRG